MGHRASRLRRQAGVRGLPRLAAVCAVLAVALIACAGEGDDSGSDVGSEPESPATLDEEAAEDGQRSTDEAQARDEGLPEDGHLPENDELPGDEHLSEDEQLVMGEGQSRPEEQDEQRVTDQSQPEDEQRATGEAQPEDGQRVGGEGQAKDEGLPGDGHLSEYGALPGDKQLSEDGQRATGEAQAQVGQRAEGEGQAEDERAEGEGQAEDEKGQQAKDEQWSEDENEDAGLDSGGGGVVERTARMVEESGGEVVFVHHAGRGDLTVLGLPAEFVDGVTPLIVSLHGYAGDSVYHSTYLPLHERVNDGGFALLLPNALPDGAGYPAWNPTDRCCDGGKAGEDDVAYLTELVAEATNSRNFGPVYFFGYSNGGFMAYHMACKALAGLRAVASLAGTSYLEDSSCDGAPPVSVLHIHGTADNVILYGGDEIDPDPGSDGERAFYASAEDMVTRWSRRAGCDWPEQAQPHARLDLDQSVPGPETRVFRPGAGCAEGISIELWVGVDSGHGPGYRDAFMDALLDWLLSQT